jgi:hypothetical protein
MLYGSFFGKVFEPARSNAGNWDMGVLTWLLGMAFITSLLGLWFSITLPTFNANEDGGQLARSDAVERVRT